MCFPFPLPGFRRGHGKRRPEVVAAQVGCCVGLEWVVWDRGGVARLRLAREGWSANGEAVTVGGFDDAAGGGHGGEALVEGGGADAAGCPQFGERPGLLAVGEDCGDALIDGGRLGIALGLAIRLDRPEGQGVTGRQPGTNLARMLSRGVLFCRPDLLCDLLQRVPLQRVAGTEDEGRRPLKPPRQVAKNEWKSARSPHVLPFTCGISRLAIPNLAAISRMPLAHDTPVVCCGVPAAWSCG